MSQQETTRLRLTQSTLPLRIVALNIGDAPPIVVEVPFFQHSLPRGIAGLSSIDDCCAWRLQSTLYHPQHVLALLEAGGIAEETKPPPARPRRIR
jgi:hypothetical protein